ncbi:type I restriction-modification system subunit M N-terminal domain-containing protein [Synechococcus sp. CBW1004]|nr:type I restriction-modification system subunit M N-terminal domain-containing protein [Synechococcus sp. CBW1004]
MEKSLWDAADQFRANSGLKAQEYSGPILGLIFLRFADARFMPRWQELKAAGGSERRGSREEDPNAYQSEGLLYLPPGSRYQELLDLPEAADIGARLNEAMGLIEQHNSKGTPEKPDRISTVPIMRLAADGGPPPVGFHGLRADLRQEENAPAALPR